MAVLAQDPTLSRILIPYKEAKWKQMTGKDFAELDYSKIKAISSNYSSEERTLITLFINKNKNKVIKVPSLI